MNILIPRQLNLLIDMDGVLANFEVAQLNRFRELNPDKMFVPIEERTGYYIQSDYPGQEADFFKIWSERGFFRNLPPIQGGPEAVRELMRLGHHVRLCTRPLLSNGYCMDEKYAWVIEHIGQEAARKLSQIDDKTEMRGDFLIDDKPDPEKKGIFIPTWEHIIYDQPYNRHVTGKKRLTWDNYKEILKI